MRWYFALALLSISTVLHAQEVQSRLWMSSSYIDYQKHKAIVGILRDAGYDVKDYTPQEIDRTRPPAVLVEVTVIGGRYYEVRYPLRFSKDVVQVVEQKNKDGFARRNGVVNGYEYGAGASGYDHWEDYYDRLKKIYSYDMEIRTLRDGTIESTPKIDGFTAIDLHTFAAAPQNDASVVLNHLYRSVLKGAEKIRASNVRVHYDDKLGKIFFTVK